MFLLENLLESFVQTFRQEAAVKFVKSPLRICPLGAHINHQNGLVTGMTLNASVNLIFSPNESGLVRVKSLDFPDEEHFHINDVQEWFQVFGAIICVVQFYH